MALDLVVVAELATDTRRVVVVPPQQLRPQQQLLLLVLPLEGTAVVVWGLATLPAR